MTATLVAVIVITLFYLIKLTIIIKCLYPEMKKNQ